MYDSTTITKTNGLVGRCFVIFGDKRRWRSQGVVRSHLGDGYYLVQFFDVLVGAPSTLQVMHVSDFNVTSGEDRRGKGCFEFFVNDEHLHDWAESHRPDTGPDDDDD